MAGVGAGVKVGVGVGSTQEHGGAGSSAQPVSTPRRTVAASAVRTDLDTS